MSAVPTVSAEQPGMGKAVGAVLGAAAGLSGGPLILAAIVPGVGPITAIGLLGGAILAAAGGKLGAVAGGKLEGAMTEGLPEDEIFVYEDALRKGRSVVVAMASEDAEAARVRELLKNEGAEAVDAAREQWWIGLRDTEREHYTSSSRNFTEEEKFYRLGFEAALHTRMRCKEFDQVCRGTWQRRSRTWSVNSRARRLRNPFPVDTSAAVPTISKVATNRKLLESGALFSINQLKPSPGYGTATLSVQHVFDFLAPKLRLVWGEEVSHAG